MEKITNQELIDFENKVKGFWENSKIPYPVHLSGGNENQLIDLFKNVKEEDYVFSTWRSHYHYLLKGGEPGKLLEMILRGDSMHVYDKDINFLSSAIVGGTACIAAGIAKAIKLKDDKEHVWCFIGDGAEDNGHVYEAIRYVDGHDLPCTFVIEDNNRAIETPKKVRYGFSKMVWPSCVKRYNYDSKYPHAGSGTWVDFGKFKVGPTI